MLNNASCMGNGKTEMGKSLEIPGLSDFPSARSHCRPALFSGLLGSTLERSFGRRLARQRAVLHFAANAAAHEEAAKAAQAIGLARFTVTNQKPAPRAESGMSARISSPVQNSIQMAPSTATSFAGVSVEQLRDRLPGKQLLAAAGGECARAVEGPLERGGKRALLPGARLPKDEDGQDHRHDAISGGQLDRPSVHSSRVSQWAPRSATR
jgi:hypothetical protein